MSGTLDLFCWVQGESHSHAFSVEIPETKTVSALREAIKEKKKVTFKNVDADALTLWKVSASYQQEPMPLRADAGNVNIDRST